MFSSAFFQDYWFFHNNLYLISMSVASPVLSFNRIGIVWAASIPKLQSQHIGHRFSLFLVGVDGAIRRIEILCFGG